MAFWTQTFSQRMRRVLRRRAAKDCPATMVHGLECSLRILQASWCPTHLYAMMYGSCPKAITGTRPWFVVFAFLPASLLYCLAHLPRSMSAGNLSPTVTGAPTDRQLARFRPPQCRVGHIRQDLLRSGAAGCDRERSGEKEPGLEALRRRSL